MIGFNTHTYRVTRPLGVILHRGKSAFDGTPYVVIAPLSKSGNVKTGGMVQTYIIRSDMHPLEAVATGGDVGICNDCAMRGILLDPFAKRSKAPPRKPARQRAMEKRACYVNVGQGPSMVYGAFIRGRYVEYNPADHDRFFQGRKIRFGTYGEPVLIPLPLVDHLARLSSGWTGYSHQWMVPMFAAYRQYFMASVHGLTGPKSAEHARHLGWRYFRTMRTGDPARGEILCPASAEAGKRLTCEQCGLCDGAGRRAKGLDLVSIYIPVHGGKAVMTAAKQLAVLN